ncbi:hypothetical protein ACUXI4_003257 [Pantoea piersonii]
MLLSQSVNIECISGTREQLTVHNVYLHYISFVLF